MIRQLIQFDQNLLESPKGLSTSGVSPSAGFSFLGVSKMSRRIKLTQGQFAIVDNKNYEWLNQWKWYAE